MRVISLSGRGETGKTHCLGHLINLIHQETMGCNCLFEGRDARMTLDYLGQRVTICTWGDTEYEELLNLDKIRSDQPDIAIVATRSKGATIELVKKFCENEGNCTLKRVEKYVACFDDLSGQEYLNNLQAEQILDYVRGLIKGQLYYVDSISAIGEDRERFHVTLLGLEMPNEGFSRTLSLELTANELAFQDIRRPILEDDFVLYRPDTDNQLLYGNEEPLAISLRDESRMLRRQLTERELHRDVSYAFFNRQPDMIKSYHVNVGHGNCSLILSVYGTDYELWMVDCSTYDYLIRCDYSLNLHSCLSDIADTLKIELGNLHISRFMLTHAHYDHYNGLKYLIKRGLIDKNTLMYVNLYYDCSSPVWKDIMIGLEKLNCPFVEPVNMGQNQDSIHIYHPECRIYKNARAMQNGVEGRIVNKVNDSSVVYGIEIGNRIMVFPGDLEQNGFEKMSEEGLCSNELYMSNYYVISHHGSLNRHPTMPCMNPDTPKLTPLFCATHRLKKAILMGRDRAFSGIYSPIVINYFNSQPADLLFSEKDGNGRPIKFFELEWNSGMVRYFY